jgi:hypothetical protein
MAVESNTTVPSPIIFFGAFAFMTVATWALDLVINPYTRATSAQVDITANLFANIGIRLAKGFGVITLSFAPLKKRMAEPAPPKAEAPLDLHPPRFELRTF